MVLHTLIINQYYKNIKQFKGPSSPNIYRHAYGHWALPCIRTGMLSNQNLQNVQNIGKEACTQTPVCYCQSERKIFTSSQHQRWRIMLADKNLHTHNQFQRPLRMMDLLRETGAGRSCLLAVLYLMA